MLAFLHTYPGLLRLSTGLRGFSKTLYAGVEGVRIGKVEIEGEGGRIGEGGRGKEEGERGWVKRVGRMVGMITFWFFVGEMAW